MQAAPRKPVPPRKRPSVGVTGAPQETFVAPAVALAKKLGWDGDPDWVGNDITVRDAQRFIAKTMHEHHQAGARGEPQPDYRAACLHLAVDNANEQAAIDGALRLAYESGKDQPVTQVETKKLSLDASMEGSAGVMLGRLAEAEAKARGK